MSWAAGERGSLWADLEQPWDVIIIGGGITGAGILREAVRAGLRALLVEQGDFASGTSSRSSKLVHGGLRYLSQGDWRLTRDAVRERDRLLREGAGLVEEQGFVMPVYDGQRPGRRTLRAALAVYDLLAGKRRTRSYSPRELALVAPRLREQGLVGALGFMDARTDDARLVLRVLGEALRDGGHAINYAQVAELMTRDGRVCGVRLEDRSGAGRSATPGAGLVINATGAWAPRLKAPGGEVPPLRALRGSHLLFPYWRLPTVQAVSFFHPRDRRPVFVYPWEGRVLAGTTDVDHAEDMDLEPRMSATESDYLLSALNYQFPGAGLTAGDAVASYAGVRSVVSTGAERPSDESRDHAFWLEPGLLTVTGGKLTTFRLTALEALEQGRHYLPRLGALNRRQSVLDPVHPTQTPGLGLRPAALRRLYGRHGADTDALLEAVGAGELQTIGSTPYLWAELRWSARAEAVVSLQDLMLRRTRIGLVAEKGGEEWLSEIGAIACRELGWDEARWAREHEDYLSLWRGHYAPA